MSRTNISAFEVALLALFAILSLLMSVNRLYILFCYIFCFAAVDCGPLPIPRNGALFGDLTVFPNEAKFSCDPGYILDGSYARKCQANGTWNGMETICKRKSHT